MGMCSNKNVKFSWKNLMTQCKSSWIFSHFLVSCEELSIKLEKNFGIITKFFLFHSILCQVNAQCTSSVYSLAALNRREKNSELRFLFCRMCPSQCHHHVRADISPSAFIRFLFMIALDQILRNFPCVEKICCISGVPPSAPWWANGNPTMAWVAVPEPRR